MATFKGLRQQTTIVIGNDRQFGHQGAVTQFGLGDLGFGCQAQAGIFIYRVAVGLARENRAAIRTNTISPAARIQTHAQQRDSVHTETDGALGEARGVVQLEALAPLFLLVLSASRFGTRVAVIGIDVEVA